MTMKSLPENPEPRQAFADLLADDCRSEPDWDEINRGYEVWLDERETVQ